VSALPREARDDHIPDERFEKVADGVYVRPMLTPDQATDLFLGDLEMRGSSKRTVDTYRRILDQFAAWLPQGVDVAKISTDECRRFLNLLNGQKRRGGGRYSQGTRAHTYSVLSSFFRWLYRTERIKRNPLERVDRPRRVPADDLDVTTVSTEDVRKLIAAARDWTEKLAIAIPAYLGPRRHAAALLRLKDYDQQTQRIRFQEKGNKTIWKPVPRELSRLLKAAIADGAITEPDDYLIPGKAAQVRKGDRDDRVVWNAVKRVADRAGVQAHVHSLRAAFAVFYLEQKPGDVEALQTLLGHKSIATTERYLRRLSREQAMERVRDLDWNVVESGDMTLSGSSQTADEPLEASVGVGAGGFEPPFAVDPQPDRAGTEHHGGAVGRDSQGHSSEAEPRYSLGGRATPSVESLPAAGTEHRGERR
jgi:integrase/recombinase XerD